jgi:hypothetical protein
MKMILRQALEKDLPHIFQLLRPWLDSDTSVGETLASLFDEEARRSTRCSVLEVDRTIQAVSLWIPHNSAEIKLLAFALAPDAPDAAELGKAFLRAEILHWSELGVSKVSIAVPDALSSSLIGCLRTCGFIFEGISSCCNLNHNPQVLLCKHLLDRVVPHSQIMTFLKDFMLSLGYEVRTEGDGFGYRIRADYRLPFIFSSWHRITRSGPDIIVHPPARVLELYELETLFYPLTIRGRNEKPLMLPLEKKRATHLVDFPAGDMRQDSLFENGATGRERVLKERNLTYTFPAGMQSMRRGLPVLFYVNRMGAVGTGRLEEWYLDEPKSLYQCIDDTASCDLKDVKEHTALSGPHAGKVLVIRFHWYKAFKRVVPFEEIRTMDEKFNPQRTRFLPSSLFQSIVAAGSRV